VVVIGKCFVEPEPSTVHHSFSRFTSRFISIRHLGPLIRQVSKKSNRTDPRMNFKQLVDETFVEAWESYHGLIIDLPTAGMEDWEFTHGFYCGLSQEAKEKIDILAGGTFFRLNTEEVLALFEKLSASERKSEEHGLKKNSHTIKIDPLTRKLQGMALTQPVASEMHQAEQEILAQPSNRKKIPMSTVPCILGPFKVHHALYDWGASMNILPKMVYDCLDEDPLVPTPHQL
jgi:translation elongation factor EF-G